MIQFALWNPTTVKWWIVHVPTLFFALAKVIPESGNSWTFGANRHCNRIRELSYVSWHPGKVKTWTIHHFTVVGFRLKSPLCVGWYEPSTTSRWWDLRFENGPKLNITLAPIISFGCGCKPRCVLRGKNISVTYPSIWEPLYHSTYDQVIPGFPARQPLFWGWWITYLSCSNIIPAIATK